ncbi:hypothetical protein F5Y07DRAFT_262492 [Xylaria sp. FL0933]|nr:hypothetical protein F5Y07DRAFT_262492 [Xylaria sp. FL0933]
MPSASCPLTCLPAELLISIISNLANRDIKNLRLTNHFFCNTAQLRFSRVFLSANPVNVEVFLTVANHETLRMGITEIIWDDALLTSNPKEHTEPDLDPAVTVTCTTELLWSSFRSGFHKPARSICWTSIAESIWMWTPLRTWRDPSRLIGSFIFRPPGTTIELFYNTKKMSLAEGPILKP